MHKNKDYKIFIFTETSLFVEAWSTRERKLFKGLMSEYLEITKTGMIIYLFWLSSQNCKTIYKTSLIKVLYK